jgi:hypothetical protein
MIKIGIRNKNHLDYFTNNHCARLDGKQNTYDIKYVYFISSLCTNYTYASLSLIQVKKTNELTNIIKDII